MDTQRTHERGFIALISMLIISAMLLILIFMLGTSTFLSRFDVLDAEQKRISLGLAEACAQGAMLRIAQNPTYTPVSGGECVGATDTCGASGAERTCKICSVSQNAGTYTILTRAVYRGAFTNVTVEGTLGSSNFSVTKWYETAAYGGPSCPLP